MTEAVNTAVKNNKSSSEDGIGSAGQTPGHRISHNSNQTYETRATDRRASRIAVLQNELPPEFFEDIERDAQKKKTPKYVTVSRSIVENNYVVAFTTILTIYALIGDDLRLICTNRPADQYFNIFVFICIFVFTLECVLSCVGKDDYYLSFFFWLDVISTVSLVLDLSYVSEELQGGGGDDDGDMSNLRGGRTARVGAKAGRVVRVLRLVRILKLYKAYYEAYEAKQRRKEREKNGPGDDDDWADFEDDPNQEDQSNQRESRVGKKLSEITTRRVIILVLTMLLVFPWVTATAADQNASTALYAADNVWQMFEAYVNNQTSVLARENYENAFLKFFFYHNWFAPIGDNCPKNQPCSGEYYGHAFWISLSGSNLSKVVELAGLARMNRAAVSRWIAANAPPTQDDIYNYGFMPDKALELLASPWETEECSTDNWQRRSMSLLKDEMDGVSFTVICPTSLRVPERKRVVARLMSPKQYEDYHFDFYLDLRSYTQRDSIMNLSTVGFICFVLCVAAMSFSNDANYLVLNPVEKMIKRVEAIRDDPLIAMKMADEEFKAEEVQKAKQKKRGKERFRKLLHDLIHCKTCSREVSEPMETVILEKTIIKLGSLLALGFGEAGANIIGANMRGSDSAGVNAMIPGRRVDCVIGVVRIRDFSVATEVLKQKIMTFVNQIAEIVHGIVDEYYGAANKNNGDMFLITWPLENMNATEITRLAEMSVCSFAMILGALHRSPLLAEYRRHPGLQQRLGTNCRVNLSFGLHLGWAIEGAVGSEFKIDASYLSPHVSVAKSIELATVTYGVPFIIAESVVNLLTESMVEKTRLMDRVIITGSPQPMTIHSVDLDFTSVRVDTSDPLKMPWTSQRRYRARQWLESEKQQKLNLSVEIKEFWEKDRNIKVMRKRFTTEFFQHFNMGYQNYAQGEWAVARRMLSFTQTMLGVDDGPSGAILHYMEEHQYVSPKDWIGVRILGQTEAALESDKSRTST
mmetsp:Transcript_92633/g.145378  ORF Transcript_92633/g.145378 Transcript_92633/m.145378 type:complete len:980 (-) Transcript_92633:6-2945(-)